MAEDSAGGGAVRRVDEGWTRGCEEQIREVADITSGGSAGTSTAADHGILFITSYKKSPLISLASSQSPQSKYEATSPKLNV